MGVPEKVKLSGATGPRLRLHYNMVRPHSKLGGRTPAEIAGQRGWGHAPSPVAIRSTISHQSKRLYF